MSSQQADVQVSTAIGPWRFGFRGLRGGEDRLGPRALTDAVPGLYLDLVVGAVLQPSDGQVVADSAVIGPVHSVVDPGRGAHAAVAHVVLGIGDASVLGCRLPGDVDTLVGGMDVEDRRCGRRCDWSEWYGPDGCGQAFEVEFACANFESVLDGAGQVSDGEIGGASDGEAYLRATWAAVRKTERDGVEAFLAECSRPEQGDVWPNVANITVNLLEV